MFSMHFPSAGREAGQEWKRLKVFEKPIHSGQRSTLIYENEVIQ